MGRSSSIPDEIRQYIPMKCCRIRKDKNVYRVYKYTAKKLDSGKWSNDYGTLIGKIVPGEGFFPNKKYLQEFQVVQRDQLPEAYHDAITDVAYGDYDLLMNLSEDIIERLKKHFPTERATQIYSYALILCANGHVYIDQVDDYYQESFLSVVYQNYAFKMGYSALSSLLHDLGLRGNPVNEFEQSLIDDSSKNIAIDGHVIRSCSELNDFAEAGYKMKLLKADQVNLLIAYDIRTKIPLLYHTFRGSKVDKASVIDLLKNKSFKDTKFVVDRGFYSAEALKIMSQNGNCYIIPIPSNNKNFKRIKKNLSFTSGEFIYKSDLKNNARIIYYEEKINDSKRIIVYKDMDENNSKRKSYQMMMAQGEESYTQEKYNEYCEWWGVYFLETTTTETAIEVFNDYKDRWSIETYNNYIKNDAHFNNLKMQDYYVVRGFDFILLVTGIIHSKLNEAVKELKIPSISTHDILIKARHLRMVLYQGIWRLQNTRTKDLELLAKMGYTPNEIYEAKKV